MHLLRKIHLNSWGGGAGAIADKKRELDGADSNTKLLQQKDEKTDEMAEVAEQVRV